MDWHNATIEKNQTKTAAHWDQIYPNLQLKQPTISPWLKEEKKWRTQWAEVGNKGLAGKSKQAEQTKHPEVNEMLELWVAKAMVEKVPVNGEILQQKWTCFADLIGVPEDEKLNLSEGWLTSFKKRCGLKEFRRHGEAASSGPADVEKERARMRELISKHKYSEFSVLRMRFIPVQRKAWEYLAWDVRADVAAIADKLCLFGHVYAFHTRCSLLFVLTLWQLPFKLLPMQRGFMQDSEHLPLTGMTTNDSCA